MVICLERGADGLHMVQLMPLPFQTRPEIVGFGDAIAKCKQFLQAVYSS